MGSRYLVSGVQLALLSSFAEHNSDVQDFIKIIFKNQWLFTSSSSLEKDIKKIIKLIEKEKSKSTKLKHYKGSFNYFGETYTFFIYAKSEELAKQNFLHKLSKKINEPFRKLQYRFDGEDNYFIREI